MGAAVTVALSLIALVVILWLVWPEFRYIWAEILEALWEGLQAHSMLAIAVGIGIVLWLI